MVYFILIFRYANTVADIIVEIIAADIVIQSAKLTLWSKNSSSTSRNIHIMIKFAHKTIILQ